MSDVRHNVKGILDRYFEDLDLDQRTEDDIRGEINALLDKSEDISECEHENVVATIPPKHLERADEIFPNHTMATGNILVFHGRCTDCGADIPVRLALIPETDETDEFDDIPDTWWDVYFVLKLFRAYANEDQDETKYIEWANTDTLKNAFSAVENVSRKIHEAVEYREMHGDGDE